MWMQLEHICASNNITLGELDPDAGIVLERTGDENWSPHAAGKADMLALVTGNSPSPRQDWELPFGHIPFPGCSAWASGSHPDLSLLSAAGCAQGPSSPFPGTRRMHWNFSCGCSLCRKSWSWLQALRSCPQLCSGHGKPSGASNSSWRARAQSRH